MSDHTQSIPRVGAGASGAQNPAAQSSGGYSPRTANPTRTASPTRAANPANGTGPTRSGARTSSHAASAAARTGMTPSSLTGQTATGPAAAKKARVNQKSGRGPRKARLQLRHIDTWSALKISLVLSIVMFFVWMVAVGILYGVLSGLGVFDAINSTVGQLGGSESAATDLITPSLVFGGSALIGAINIVLFTALATIATYIYNLSADLVGGLEVTLTERE